MNKRPRRSTNAADPIRLPKTEAQTPASKPSSSFLVSTPNPVQSDCDDFNSETPECSSLFAHTNPDNTERHTNSDDPFFCQGSTSNQASSVTVSEWQTRPVAPIQGICKPLSTQDSDDSETISFYDDETITFVSDARTITYNESPTLKTSLKPEKREGRGQLVGDSIGSKQFDGPVPTEHVFKIPAALEKKTEGQGARKGKRKHETVWHSVDSRDFNHVHVQWEGGIGCKQNGIMLQSKISFQGPISTAQPTHVDSRTPTAQKKDPRSQNKGFVRFSSCVRFRYQSLNPDMSNKEVMILIANAWRALDQSEKDYFRNPDFATELRFFDMSSYLGRPSK